MKGGDKSEKVLKVRHSRKRYFIIYAMIIILAILILILKASGKTIEPSGLKMAVIFSVAAILFIEIHRLSSYYEINPSSIIFVTGLINRKTRKFNLYSISDADSSQHVFGRIFNYGDVNVHLFEHISSIKGINNPNKFLNFLIETMGNRRR